MSAVVQAGYKQTEVGVIPEDWIAVQIGDLARFASGKGISVATLQVESAGSPIPVFGGNGIAGYTKIPTVHSPCVVVGRVGQKCGEVYLSDGPAWITDNALYPKDLHRPIDQRFFALALKASKLNEAKNKNDLPLITQTILAGITIPWPPLPEQRAIATTLSDVDALLAKLDALVAKKRDLKVAAMQQLLTGQTRLPGFSGEWEVKRLGDVLKVRHGRSQHEVVVPGGIYPILATGGEIGRTNVCLYDKPSVLIGRKGTIDKPQYQDAPFWTVDTLFYTELFNSVHPKFIYFKFLMVDWRSYNEASGVPSLNASTIENIEVKVPNLGEQTAIATVLSDMDAELTALEARRDKTHALKQGMMQELLTGRIRLV